MFIKLKFPQLIQQQKDEQLIIRYPDDLKCKQEEENLEYLANDIEKYA